MTWRDVSNWAVTNPWSLRVADRLGRGRGGLRFFDRMHKPAPAPHRPDLSRWHRQELAAVWIGHSTVLLRVGETTILTDPVFSNSVGVGLGFMTAGPKRLVAPALALRQLPRIDLILISHAHFDHLDRPTLNHLDRRIPIITCHHTADLMRDLGFHRITELRWGESSRVGGVRITGHEVRHWGARTFHDRHRGYSGYLIETDRRRVFYAGDTAHCNLFHDLRRVDLAIFGIGAYDPWIDNHATPEQAWDMANQCRAEYFLPMHHSTFRLSNEPLTEPIERLLTVAAGQRDRIVLTEIGGQWAW